MQRRDFLQLCAISGLASTAVVATATGSQHKPILVGQIGIKHAHAAGQMQTIRELPELFEMVGLVEPDDKRYAEVAMLPAYLGVPRLRSVEELLGISGLQIVAVETEVRELLTNALLCAKAGKHIHLDKPAGESLKELRALQECAAEQELMIQMGYMFRYNSAFEFLFHAVREGWLGEIFEVHGVISSRLGVDVRRGLADYPGGSMFELGCHLIDPLVRILGKPDHVTPYRRRTRKTESLYDNMLAVFEYPQVTATIRSCLVEVDASQRRQFVVCGDKGTIAIQPLEPPRLVLTLSEATGQFRKGTHQLDLPRSKGRYHGAWEEMARVLGHGVPFPYSYQHDFAVQQTLLAAAGVGELESAV